MPDLSRVGAAGGCLEVGGGDNTPVSTSTDLGSTSLSACFALLHLHLWHCLSVFCHSLSLVVFALLFSQCYSVTQSCILILHLYIQYTCLSSHFDCFFCFHHLCFSFAYSYCSTPLQDLNNLTQIVQDSSCHIIVTEDPTAKSDGS